MLRVPLLKNEQSKEEKRRCITGILRGYSFQYDIQRCETNEMSAEKRGIQRRWRHDAFTPHHHLIVSSMFKVHNNAYPTVRVHVPGTVYNYKKIYFIYFINYNR